MNPNLKGKTGYVIRVNLPPEAVEETTMFVGEFNDNNYHVMGYIPDSIKADVTEAEATNSDHGVIVFPKGKKSISDLAEGDIFKFRDLPAKFLKKA